MNYEGDEIIAGGYGGVVPLGRVVPVGQYPGGEPIVWNDPFSQELWSATSPMGWMLLRPTSMETLLAAMFLVDAWVDRGKTPPRLYLPLMPGGRQDRLNDQGDYLFTARSVAKMINGRGFPSVVTFDPHSDVTPALLDRCKVYRAADLLKPHFLTSKWDAVVSPDAGAEKRAAAVASMYGIPLLHGWKKRDVVTGALAGFGLESVPDDLAGAHVLVVDDLCDGGGTFLGLADVLDAAGLTADLYVTHGLFTKGTAPLLERFRQVITTDSVISDKTGVFVIPVCEDIASWGYFPHSQQKEGS